MSLSRNENNLLPANIHFIWIGKPIPPKYLYSISRLCKLATRYKFNVNLWVDKEANLIKTLIADDCYLTHLRIRNIFDLSSIMASDSFYATGERYKKIISILERELVGFVNYSAVSDILRLVILLQEGGIYIDCDTVLKIDENTQLFQETLKFGIKLRWRLQDDIIKMASDVIASIPHHPLLEAALDSIMDSYDLDQTTFPKLNIDHKFENIINTNDLRRFPFFYSPGDANLTRLNLTTKTFCPTCLIHGFLDYINSTYDFKDDLSVINFLKSDEANYLKLNDPELEQKISETSKICGLITETKYDNNWLEKIGLQYHVSLFKPNMNLYKKNTFNLVVTKQLDCELYYYKEEHSPQRLPINAVSGLRECLNKIKIPVENNTYQVNLDSMFTHDIKQEIGRLFQCYIINQRKRTLISFDTNDLDNAFSILLDNHEVKRRRF